MIDDMLERLCSDGHHEAANEIRRLRAAVAAEREACAVLVECWADGFYRRNIAAAIRARGTK